jgi:hypothetical protein
MPSDTPLSADPKAGPATDAVVLELAQKALTALDPRVDAFHSAVATAEEEIRSFVSTRRVATESRTERTLGELGPFAVGLIDPEKFATLLLQSDDLSEDEEGVLKRAEQILADFSMGRDFHHVVVEPGGDLRDAVKEALDHVGQVFGAARAVELARSGLFDPAQHNSFLSGVPFRKWNREERQLAPPLVVAVDADDLLPAGLGEFLDGLVKVVLVVRGVVTPAPLARLITPGTYVVQTADPAELTALARSPHPGVGLLFDGERPEHARFVHDPDAGGTPWQRLTVSHLPDRPEVGRGRRAPTWLEELTHLEALAKKPDLVPAANGAGTPGSDAATAPGVEPATPADQLAAFLLSQVDLEA